MLIGLALVIAGIAIAESEELEAKKRIAGLIIFIIGVCIFLLTI